MPTYEYECTACGHQFDLFQKMTDAPAASCPECGGKVSRIPGLGAGIIFKGSGFHATDYRSRDYKEKAKGESGAKPGDGAKASHGAAGDAKPKEPGPAKDTGKSDR